MRAAILRSYGKCYVNLTARREVHNLAVHMLRLCIEKGCHATTAFGTIIRRDTRSRHYLFTSSVLVGSRETDYKGVAYETNTNTDNEMGEIRVNIGLLDSISAAHR